MGYVFLCAGIVTQGVIPYEEKLYGSSPDSPHRTLWGQGGKIFPFEYKKVELENGFKAYLIHAGAPGQIAYVTVVRSGSRDEYEPGRSGYAHFFEHMMFRGTGRYPKYDAIAGALGALYNASTSNDFTQYYLVASRDTLEQVIDLESDRFMNLQYTESQFRTEVGAILGEFSQGKSNPFYRLEEKTADFREIISQQIHEANFQTFV